MHRDIHTKQSESNQMKDREEIFYRKKIDRNMKMSYHCFTLFYFCDENMVFSNT